MLGCGWAVPPDGPTVQNSPRLKARTAADITVPSLAIVTLLHPVPGAKRRCRPAHAAMHDCTHSGSNATPRRYVRRPFCLVAIAVVL